MGAALLLSSATALSCALCFAIASPLEIAKSSHFELSTTAREGEYHSYQWMNDDVPKDLKTGGQLSKLVNSLRTYMGKSSPGVSVTQMRTSFKNKLNSSVEEHLSKSLGGIITEFGEADDSLSGDCLQRPTLTLDDVSHLARMSFNLSDFEASYPPCLIEQGASEVTCPYGGGKCCKRPQLEFVARYYDTAVAAMALGATAEEAFATLIHARVLAYALQSCDPDLSHVGTAAGNYLWYHIQPSGRQTELYRAGIAKDMSTVTFPVAYEVLYELYNTMLIERMQSRRATQIPTAAQMHALRAAVYYKKVLASQAPLYLELSPVVAYPDADDFQAAGLVLQTSSRLAARSDTTPPSDGQGQRLRRDSEWRPGARVVDATISVFERSSNARKTLDRAICNVDLPVSAYYPFKIEDSVWSKRQACCADDCYFMAMYGGTFSKDSANCCAGCNRYSCTANNVDAAQYLAELSTIESASKANTGAEEIAIVV